MASRLGKPKYFKNIQHRYVKVLSATVGSFPLRKIAYKIVGPKYPCKKHLIFDSAPLMVCVPHITYYLHPGVIEELIRLLLLLLLLMLLFLLSVFLPRISSEMHFE
jgi:hypothetical protein